jgi:hypothetical protein
LAAQVICFCAGESTPLPASVMQPRSSGAPADHFGPDSGSRSGRGAGSNTAAPASVPDGVDGKEPPFGASDVGDSADRWEVAAAPASDPMGASGTAEDEGSPADNDAPAPAPMNVVGGPAGYLNEESYPNAAIPGAPSRLLPQHHHTACPVTAMLQSM